MIAEVSELQGVIYNSSLEMQVKSTFRKGGAKEEHFLAPPFLKVDLIFKIKDIKL